MIIRFANRLLKPFKYAIKKERPDEGLQDIFSDKDFVRIYELVKPYTMTSIQRIYTLYKSVEYVIEQKISGDFVECGVWRGGSSMTIGLTLKKWNIFDREIYLYDTFEGMPEPTDNDKDIYGNRAGSLLGAKSKINTAKDIWCYATLEDVTKNMQSIGYPANKVHYLKGKVEDTIPATIPFSIALLRLDTDWYESTAHEMKHLFPLLNHKGVLIIDDYGHWEGAKKAVDEYISGNRLSLFLHRVDDTARSAIKI